MRMMVTPVSASPGEQRALNGRGAAPARQQRGMDVEAAERGHRQRGRRQDQAVGDHDQRIESQRAQQLERFGRLETRWADAPSSRVQRAAA